MRKKICSFHKLKSKITVVKENRTLHTLKISTHSLAKEEKPASVGFLPYKMIKVN